MGCDVVFFLFGGAAVQWSLFGGLGTGVLFWGGFVGIRQGVENAVTIRMGACK
jgi:hypothetical protein